MRDPHAPPWCLGFALGRRECAIVGFAAGCCYPVARHSGRGRLFCGAIVLAINCAVAKFQMKHGF